MATQGGKKKLPGKPSVSSSNFYIPPLPVAPPPVHKSDGEDVVGWIAACVLVAFLLPLLAMLYLDVLETKHEAKQQIEKVEKLRREVERKNREQNRNHDSDGIPDDRVRR